MLTVRFRAVSIRIDSTFSCCHEIGGRWRAEPSARTRSPRPSACRAPTSTSSSAGSTRRWRSGGCITVPGRVGRAYFEKRLFGGEGDYDVGDKG